MKKVAALGVGLLMLGTASQASASFETGNVIMSIYDTAADYEMGLDLGTLSNVTAASNVTLYSGLSFTGLNFAPLTSGIGVFTTGADQNEDNYWGSVATNRSTGINMSTELFNGMTFYGLAKTVGNGYSSIDSDNNGIITSTASSVDSYVGNMQYGKNGEAGTPNFYSGMVSEPYAEAEFPASNPYVDLYLYQFATDLNTYELYQVGDSYAATIRLTASGDVILNPTQSSEVPVPGAVWLLTSGLVGLAGLRRRYNS